MPLPNYSGIAEAARFALWGDLESHDTPSERALQYVTDGVLADFLAANPCTADGDGGYNRLNPADTRALEQAVGALVADEFLGTPAGITFAGEMEQIKTGSVTTTRKPADINDLRIDCKRKAKVARLRISCVRQALASGGTALLFDLAGPSRAREERCG